jgi:hypothetical protein
MILLLASVFVVIGITLHQARRTERSLAALRDLVPRYTRDEDGRTDPRTRTRRSRPNHRLKRSR